MMGKTRSAFKDLLKGTIFVLAATLAMVEPETTKAQESPISGMELQSLCASSDTMDRTACLFYLSGFIDGFVPGQQFAQIGAFVCGPLGVTAPQLSLMLQKTARDHPEVLNKNSNIIAAQSILDAFRCKPGQVPSHNR